MYGIRPMKFDTSRPVYQKQAKELHTAMSSYNGPKLKNIFEMHHLLFKTLDQTQPLRFWVWDHDKVVKEI